MSAQTRYDMSIITFNLVIKSLKNEAAYFIQELDSEVDKETCAVFIENSTNELIAVRDGMINYIKHVKKHVSQPKKQSNE